MLTYYFFRSCARGSDFCYATKVPTRLVTERLPLHARAPILVYLFQAADIVIVGYIERSVLQRSCDGGYANEVFQSYGSDFKQNLEFCSSSTSIAT